MDTCSRPNGTPAYTEHDVTALLNAQGGRLYWYFRLMLGDDAASTRALAGTVIAALPDPGHRDLFGTARTVCRQYPADPAVPYARAEAPTLVAATRAALRRLEPADREICVLSAPAYPLNDADLGAVFGTREVENLLSRPMSAFTGALSACAADASLEQDEDLVTRAWRLVGTGQVSLPYDAIVPLATDPDAEWLREGIRARVGATARAVQARQSGLELLGTGPQQTVTVEGTPEHPTVPLPRVPRKAEQHSGHWPWAAVAGTALAAGAIPVALVAWAGHSTQPAQHVASPPLSAAVPGAPASSGGSHAGADKSTVRPGTSGTYRGRHARTGSGTQHVAQRQAGSANVPTTMTVSGSAAAPSAPVTAPPAPAAPPVTTTAPPPVTTSAPPPATTTPPPVTTTTTGTGHGNGNGGVGNGNGNGNSNDNGNGGVGNVNGNNGNVTGNNGNNDNAG